LQSLVQLQGRLCVHTASTDSGRRVYA
jgi:hypothetical protein